MKAKINTFIFDCFGVICRPPITSWYEENIINHGFSDNNFFNTLKDFDLGNLTEEELYEYFSNYKEITYSKNDIKNQIDSYLKFDSGLADIILKLKNNGFKIALLSNGNNSFFERKVYKDYPEFKNMFDEIIISSNVKMVKPDPNIYTLALNKINSKPEESLFIDDSKTNIDGAVKVGINGYLYTDANLFIEYIKNFGIDLDK